MNKVFRVIGTRQHFKWYCAVDQSYNVGVASDLGGKYNIDFPNKSLAEETKQELQELWPENKYTVVEELVDEIQNFLHYKPAEIRLK